MKERYNHRELAALVRSERLELQQQLLKLRADARAIGRMIVQAEERLDELDKAENLLGGL